MCFTATVKFSGNRKAFSVEMVDHAGHFIAALVKRVFDFCLRRKTVFQLFVGFWIFLPGKLFKLLIQPSGFLGLDFVQIDPFGNSAADFRDAELAVDGVPVFLYFFPDDPDFCGIRDCFPAMSALKRGKQDKKSQKNRHDGWIRIPVRNREHRFS